MNPLAPARILWLLAASALTAQQPAPEPAPAATTPVDPNAALVEQARTKLAAIGYQVPAELGMQSRKAKEVIADLDAQQDLLFPPHAFLLQHALMNGLGQKAGRDAKQLRERAVAGMARGLSAYYDPIRRTFVLLPSRTRQTAEALAGSLLPLITHELVHACQDTREGGIQALFGAARASLDEAMARRCVLEGEAEVAAVAALRGNEAVATLIGNTFASQLEGLFAGELTGLLYGTGRDVMARRFAAGGFAAVQELWKAPPTSTEQLLHPDKLGEDLPQAIELPEFAGWRPLASTVVGELLSYHMLRQSGADLHTAAIATAGWDGDRLLVMRRTDAKPDDDENGAPVAVWRSVFDRSEDAAQFAAALRSSKRGRLEIHERVVDWIGNADPDVADPLLAKLAETLPPVAAGGGDATSTAAVEAVLLEQQRNNGIVDGRWRLGRAGLSIPVPDGWQLQEVQGMTMLTMPSTQRQGFLVNVNVQIQPRGATADLDAQLAAARQEFDRLTKMTVVQLELGTQGEMPVLRTEYHGVIPGLPAMHGLQLHYLRGDQIVIVTATTGEKQWDQHEAVVRQLMADLQIAP
ncbi:MAG: hypothetical protein MUC36_16425 [Planctomycetes bacterium]|jgi:hypothetical protein|nr:hypothetical protein [Planctomycetota bacterium]